MIGFRELKAIIQKFDRHSISCVVSEERSVISILAQGLLVAGTIILMGTIVLVRRLIVRLPAGPWRNRWYAMAALVVIFITGYLGYASIFWNNHSKLLDLIVPGVFFFGSCFVWLTGAISLQTTKALITAKDAAEKSNLYLRAIWDTTPSGIVVIDQGTRQIVDANPFARRLMDRTREELIGRECHSYRGHSSGNLRNKEAFQMKKHLSNAAVAISILALFAGAAFAGALKQEGGLAAA